MNRTTVYQLCGAVVLQYLLILQKNFGAQPRAELWARGPAQTLVNIYDEEATGTGKGG